MATFVGYGGNDTGGQAEPSLEPQTIVWNVIGTPENIVPTVTALRGPTNVGVLYQTGGGGTTPGFGQIFPTGRS
jgi:hypothetical protein